jgi:uncharacterized protein (TIGR03663 family)
MNRWVAVGLALALGLGLALRCLHLGARPMHNDEAVNAVKFGQLWQTGRYQYDPNEHHGPTLYYATDWLGHLTGGPDYAHYSEARLRLLTVLFGAGLIALIPLLVDGLGRRGTLWAGFFFALSPAFVFYSRYYIHEMLLVFFAALALGAGWRYWRSRKITWALLAGAGFGLMQATKETFVMSLFAAALAMFLNHTWNRLFDASGAPVKAPPLNWLHILAAAGVWISIFVLFFSSFFTNFQGLLDAFRTYTPWMHRAGGESPDIHGRLFYLHRLLWFHAAKGPVWTELLILALGLIAVWAAFVRQRLGRASASFVRFLSIYAFLLTAIYSLLPYKTPWCLLNFWHPVIYLAGVGAAVLLRFCRCRPARLAMMLLLLAGSGHLGWQAWRAAVPLTADQRNPYVYAQTSPDLLKLVQKLQDLAAASPEGTNMLVKVMAAEGDYWPLPWYLRTFGRVGWWDHIPENPYGAAMVVSANLRAELDQKQTHLMVQYFELRPQVLLELYVEEKLWLSYLARHMPARE